jgi:DNA-binding transcriptional ArsR family regulator
MTEEDATKGAEILFLLSRPERQLLFEALLSGEGSVNDLAKAAGIAQSTTSIMLNRIAKAGLTDIRRNGQMRYYQIAENRRSFVRNILDVSYAVEKPPAAIKRPYTHWEDRKPAG